MRCRYFRRFTQIGIVPCLVGVWQLMHPPVTSANTNPDVKTRFISISGASWSDLAHGGYGSGYILYYLPGRDVSHPSLVVRMARAKDDPNAIADIYDAPQGQDYVPVSLHSSTVVSNNVKASIVMTALGGWWVKNGLANYNLHVEIDEPMYAMWGEPTYANQLPSNQQLFTVETRADAHGIPEWDMRTLLPPLPGEGVYRTNYSQRESNNPVSWVRGPSPLFPYIAYQGGYEQPNGSLVPPVVVDWINGRILDFSEIVTVRHQNASYDFDSLSPIVKGAVNKPDFESPWGFYDLSGKGHGYPNLVIRTDHYDALDPWSIGIDQRFITAPLMDYSADEIRYSWADHPGNQLFDYKVDVFGFHPYNHVQSIAEGKMQVEAPAYAGYPKWVIDHSWDSITFVDTNGGGYPTSEGIYDWAARDVGNTYWRGWTTTPVLSEFQTIQKGLRGEYEVGVSEKSTLYLSPVDNRLHLLHAQGGRWNLGNGLVMEEYNLNQGPYIDGWKLVNNKQFVISQIYQSSGYLVEADGRGIRIARTSLIPSTRTILPPTDHSTWIHFSKLASHLKGKKPTDLASWIPRTKHSPILMTKAFLTSFTVQSGGFQMVVDVPANHPVTHSAARTLNLPASSGSFVIRYDQNHKRWSTRYARPAHPKASVTMDEIHHAATIHMFNTGDQNYNARVTVSINGSQYVMPALHLQAGQSQDASLPLNPSTNPTLVTVSANHQILYQHVFPAEAYVRPSVPHLLTLSVPNRRLGLYGLGTLVALLIIGVFRLASFQSKDEHA